MGKEEYCSGFCERVCQFISGKSSLTGDPLEGATREERESERSQISQKDIDWRNAVVVERRVRTTGNRLEKGPIESGMILDESATIPGHVPVQETQLKS